MYIDYLVKSGVTRPKFTKFTYNVENSLPSNLLKSALRYSTLFWNAKASRPILLLTVVSIVGLVVDTSSITRASHCNQRVGLLCDAAFVSLQFLCYTGFIYARLMRLSIKLSLSLSLSLNYFGQYLFIYITKTTHGLSTKQQANATNLLSRIMSAMRRTNLKIPWYRGKH